MNQHLPSTRMKQSGDRPAIFSTPGSTTEYRPKGKTLRNPQVELPN
jgi:hypothetical protein